MSDEKTTGGFSDAELAAMKQRAAELRVEGAGGTGTAKKKREAKACEDALAALEGSDHAIGNRLHEIVREEAPHLDPKTWYGFPSCARDGKVVVFFTPKDHVRRALRIPGLQHAGPPGRRGLLAHRLRDPRDDSRGRGDGPRPGPPRRGLSWRGD